MPYNWQCIAGHAGEIPAGSPLEAKAGERKTAGFLDAVCLSELECPQCRADRIARLRREMQFCDPVDCGEMCRYGCLNTKEISALESGKVSLRDLVIV